MLTSPDSQPQPITDWQKSLLGDALRAVVLVLTCAAVGEAAFLWSVSAKRDEAARRLCQVAATSTSDSPLWQAQKCNKES